MFSASVSQVSFSLKGTCCLCLMMGGGEVVGLILPSKVLNEAGLSEIPFHSHHYSKM